MDNIDEPAQSDNGPDFNHLKKAGYAAHTYFSACQEAYFHTRDERLYRSPTELGLDDVSEYQARNAAVLTYEVAYATNALQLDLLKRLDRNRNLMVLAILMLLYLIAR